MFSRGAFLGTSITLRDGGRSAWPQALETPGCIWWYECTCSGRNNVPVNYTHCHALPHGLGFAVIRALPMDVSMSCSSLFLCGNTVLAGRITRTANTRSYLLHGCERTYSNEETCMYLLRYSGQGDRLNICAARSRHDRQHRPRRPWRIYSSTSSERNLHEVRAMVTQDRQGLHTRHQRRRRMPRVTETVTSTPPSARKPNGLCFCAPEGIADRDRLTGGSCFHGSSPSL